MPGEIEDVIAAICDWEFRCCDDGERVYRLGPDGADVADCVDFFTFQLNESNQTNNPFPIGSSAAALLGTIKKLKAMNVTTIIVSHRSNLLELADKILLMIDGQAAKFGDARTVVEEMAGKRRVIQPGGAPGGPKTPPAMANEKGMGA